MATKAQHTAFNRSVAAYLQSIGAEIKSNSRLEGEWILKTTCGNLFLSLHEPERSEVFSLYCRFEDTIKYHDFFMNKDDGRLNHYSGKWNFHSYDAKELLEEFKEQIAPLLINEKV